MSSTKRISFSPEPSIPLLLNRRRLILLSRGWIAKGGAGKKLAAFRDRGTANQKALSLIPLMEKRQSPSEKIQLGTTFNQNPSPELGKRVGYVDRGIADP